MALSKMGSTVFTIGGTDFEIKNNRIFPSVIKKIQKWSAAWVKHNRREVIRDEDPQRDLEVENTVETEDGHSVMGTMGTQVRQREHHKETSSEGKEKSKNDGTRTEMHAGKLLKDSRRVETNEKTMGKKQRTIQATSSTTKQGRVTTVLERDNEGNPIIRAEYEDDWEAGSQCSFVTEAEQMRPGRVSQPIRPIHIFKIKRRKESRAGSEMALLANALLGEVKKIREGTEDVKRKVEDLEKKSQAPSREGAFFTPPVGRLRLGRPDETPS
jgi:hypothetical protein